MRLIIRGAVKCRWSLFLLPDASMPWATRDTLSLSYRYLHLYPLLCMLMVYTKNNNLSRTRMVPDTPTPLRSDGRAFWYSTRSPLSSAPAVLTLHYVFLRDNHLRHHQAAVHS